LIIINFFTLFLSYFLYKRVLGYKLFRIVLYLPAIIGGVAFSIVFRSCVNVGGPIYEILRDISGREVELYADSRYALWALLFYVSWKGLGGMIYQGAMARIPTEVFEAAILDGITPWKEFTRIVMPMIWPTITTLLILSFTGIFTASGPILLFTNGRYGTMTISFWLWDQIYTYNAVHSAAAVGMIYTAIGAPLCLIFRKLMLKIQENVEY
jgi:multiple sugar transport system permease protein/N-acetylglucosamine transport system permease protein